MRYQRIAVLAAGVSFCTVAAADVVRHTTVNMNTSGKVTEYTEMVADDDGNLRVEIYAADADGNRGALKDLVVFQVMENRMLTSSSGKCQAIDFDDEELPGGVSKDEVMAARAEMQKALEEMRASNPEMAKMLESQMGGMAAMMSDEKPAIKLTRTGATRDIDGYDTIEFSISGMPGAGADYRVWAADIDDVDGADVMSAASAKMAQAHKQMMDKMGMGEMLGANIFTEIMEEMTDYYPIMTDDGRRQTKLISTDGNGSDDFYPACNP